MQNRNSHSASMEKGSRIFTYSQIVLTTANNFPFLNHKIFENRASYLFHLLFSFILTPFLEICDCNAKYYKSIGKLSQDPSHEHHKGDVFM